MSIGVRQLMKTPLASFAVDPPSGLPGLGNAVAGDVQTYNPPLCLPGYEVDQTTITAAHVQDMLRRLQSL
jgi:hypothetical protein